MCSSTSRGFHSPSIQIQLISFHMGDNSVNTWPLSILTRHREKGTGWLQWEGENSTLTDGWLASYVLPQGWTIKILLAWGTLKIFLLTGISKRNILCRKKKKNVVVYSNICDKCIGSNLTQNKKYKKKLNLDLNLWIL